ncbi:polysaccharide deacetylase family protein [Pseudalkalibacillus berkeleyi]|uniref:Polysaccharide deacetylase family protein n=1 Tax=Pseudalkalibacillus berkeleyi TaxID=1069813 RepID=A0ABS9H4L7_9BACL|nr:polysaccharide deacetylase family protein [Pseudalkalibacillus berkeleyi]MCF6138728.1 polysaccharide deacetylase family protein [Pseudalkalibacillus berkeleyi]
MKSNNINQHRKTGTLVVSLDFELFWGLWDQGFDRDDYQNNIIGIQKNVPETLHLFNTFNVHATWAVVGFMYYKNKQELLAEMKNASSIMQARMSLARYIKELENIQSEDPFHFAPSLIRLISSYPHQEIATHTYSHHYSLENKNTHVFREDLRNALNISRRNGHTISSIVFPKNQINEEHLAICRENNLSTYRGNESSWFYDISANERRKYIKRALRLLDTYVNISGHHTYTVNRDNPLPLNVPSSRQIKPYSKKLRMLEPLRLKRIKDGLTHAAKKGEVFHIWWHPHNFGANFKENMHFLREVLTHYADLKTNYGMTSKTMNEVYQEKSKVFQMEASK